MQDCDGIRPRSLRRHMMDVMTEESSEQLAAARRGLVHLLDQRDVVALQKNTSCGGGGRRQWDDGMGGGLGGARESTSRSLRSHRRT